jgi:hypothetical protein
MLTLAVQRDLRALPACPEPEPQTPCPLPHGGATFPVDSEPELQACVEAWSDAFRNGTRRIMPPSLTAFLLYRFFVEGYTHEALVEEARERGRG